MSERQRAKELLRLRVFGNPDQLARVEPAVNDAFAQWKSIWQPPSEIDIRYFHSRPELHGHVLLLGQSDLGPNQPSMQVAGCAVDPDAAATSCVGELVERHLGRAWINPTPKRATVASFEPEDAFPVADYLGAPVFPDRWPYPRFTADRPLTWTQARCYPDGDPIWVPESLVGLGAPAPAERLGEVTTVGLAAGSSYRQAAAHGLYEMLERATVMDYWQTHRAFELLTGAAIVDHTDFLATDKMLGWHTQLLQARSAAGTGVAVALTRHTEIPAFGIGLSAHPDPAERLRHALAEAVQVRLLASLQQGNSTDTLTSFQDHLTYYCHPLRFADLDTLVGPPSDEVIERPTEDDAQLAGRLTEAGSRVIAVELAGGTADGPAVVRVRATRLPHMEVRESCACLPAPALTTAATPGPYRPHPYP
ncbi:YcaO-like family protein [Nocardia suismassiliense]|uniref:YcaO-like family protein n=1 Tax=Nocardia suismassiliense TaxID=2077092 RepID=UPI000D1ED60B|nr:YcaO-like family protein [Nocardia suismassiliense]